MHFISYLEDEILLDDILIFVCCPKVKHFFRLKVSNLWHFVECIDNEEIQPNMFPVLCAPINLLMLFAREICKLWAAIDHQGPVV